MSVKRLAILGATGSIGRSALEVVRARPDRFALESLAAGNSWQTLAELAREFRPRLVAIGNAEHEPALRDALAGTGVAVRSGPEGVLEASASRGAQMLLSAAVGAAGLAPTLAAIDAGLEIALANKETLVMAGELVSERLRLADVRLLPVDSEHSAVFQCLRAGRREDVRRIVLTASGGPFRGRGAAELSGVRAEDALAHPTWSMGPKITIDSATLVNKALEVIEAHWLFEMPYERIEVVVHPQSVVHSFVEFVDGGLVAQLGPTDMKIPIQYALTFPERMGAPVEPMTLSTLCDLTFEAPDRNAFPCLDLGYEAGRRGGLAPAVFSAANEAAVELFLRDEIGFDDIPRRIASALAAHETGPADSLERILEADAAARRHVREAVAEDRPPSPQSLPDGIRTHA